MTDHEDEEKMGDLIHMFEQGPDLPGVKVCSRCGEEKPATKKYFAPYSVVKHKLRGVCRLCRGGYRNASRKVLRKSDPEKYQVIAREEQKKRRRKLGMKDREEHRKERLASKTKVCSKCSAEKLKKAFPKTGANTIDGLSTWCKDCLGREQSSQRDRMYWESRLVTHARERHKRMGFSKGVFDLDTNFLRDRFEVQGGRCFWFNLPMKTKRKSGSMQVSLDRLDPNQGYTRTNVVLTCKAANLARNSDSVEDFEILLELLPDALKEKR